MSLPSTRQFITQLLESLPAPAENTVAGVENSNPLSGVPESAKNQLLALQVLFPNEFLPALDLLDRGLVTRLSIQNGNGEDADTVKRGDDTTAGPDEGENAGQRDVNMEDEPDRAVEQTNAHVEHNLTDVSAHTAHSSPNPATYYVRSAQQRSSRFSSSYDTTASYEVRLLAWNCSCPAFAFAAFPAVHPEPAVPKYDPRDHASDNDNQVAEGTGKASMFGGASLGDAIPPVCKHLLACVLVEKCADLFGHYVEEKDISVEEAAGWAAGWGD